MKTDDPNSAPLVPGLDEAAAENAEFLGESRSTFAKLTGRMGFEIYSELLTRSPTLGLVWRADFKRTDETVNPKFVNRFVHRQPLEGDPSILISIGQDVPPLSVRNGA